MRSALFATVALAAAQVGESLLAQTPLCNLHNPPGDRADTFSPNSAHLRLSSLQTGVDPDTGFPQFVEQPKAYMVRYVGGDVSEGMYLLNCVVDDGTNHNPDLTLYPAPYPFGSGWIHEGYPIVHSELICYVPDIASGQTYEEWLDANCYKNDGACAVMYLNDDPDTYGDGLVTQEQNALEHCDMSEHFNSCPDYSEPATCNSDIADYIQAREDDGCALSEAEQQALADTLAACPSQ